jgi:hypothetical protein
MGVVMPEPKASPATPAVLRSGHAGAQALKQFSVRVLTGDRRPADAAGSKAPTPSARLSAPAQSVGQSHLGAGQGAAARYRLRLFRAAGCPLVQGLGSAKK